MISSALIFLIRFYQLTLGRALPRSCRFSMSCSDFSLWAIKTFGPLRGFWFSLRRIISCNPFYGAFH